MLILNLSCLNKKLLFISLFISFHFLLIAQSVVINELNYRVKKADEQVQYIELYNTSNQTIDLSGWVIEEAVYYQIPSGTMLNANSYLIVADNINAIQNEFNIPGGVAVLGPWKDKLNDNGERINLRNSNYEFIDQVAYSGWQEWPNTKNGAVRSIQKMHPLLPGEYGGSWDGKTPTPGRANSSILVPDPATVSVVKEIAHSPENPVSGEAVEIEVEIANNGQNSGTTVNLEYQIVTPGNYIRRASSSYNTGWIPLDMRDDGQGQDATANDGTYTTEIPANVQVHRRLIRYRVTVQNNNGFSKTFPDPEFDEANYAYYVYDGFPTYNGYDITQLNEMQSIQVIADLDNTSSVTVVYGGEIYDHVDFSFQNFYNASRKNIRFNFNSGHSVKVANDFGQDYEVRRDKLSLSGTYMNDINGHGLTESLIFKLFELNNSTASYADYTQLRIVSDSNENAGGNDGDFWGVYVIRDYVRYGGAGIDGDFLAQRKLPDGNIYGYKNFRLHHEGADGPYGINNSVYTDWNNTLGDSQDGCSSCSVPGISQNYIEANLDLDNHFGFMAAQEFVANNETNYAGQHCYFEYYNPENQKWQIFPDDFNAAFGAPRDEVALYDRSDCDPDEDVKGPLKEQLTAHNSLRIRFENTIRSGVDLLYNEDQGEFLVDNEAAKIYNQNAAYSWTNLDKTRWGQPYSDYADVKQWYKDYIDDRKDYLNNTYGSGKIPNKPSINYTGPAGFPLDQLTFQNSAFADPQGVNTFASLEWRIGEWSDPANPVYDDREDDIYEIIPVWLSGKVNTFSNTYTVDGKGLRQGHTYRVRVKYTDNTGRESRWSDPIEFIAGAPLNAATSPLVISEIMYNPKADCGNEFIEITNAGNTSVSLDGYYFADGVEYSFPRGQSLAAGNRLIIAKDSLAFTYQYGFAPFGEYQKQLSDVGERIELRGTYDVVEDVVTYSNTWGNGSPNDALELIDPQLDNSNPNNWAKRSSICGSPEAEYENIPYAADDNFDILNDATLSGNVLLNDNFFNTVNAEVTTIPINGILTFNNDGSFTYIPNPNFNGTDSFVYQICTSPAYCDQGTVNINVESGCIELNLHVLLEGNYDPATGDMTTTQNTLRGLLPGQTPASNLVTPTPAGQPYNTAPWNYNGTEGASWTDAEYTDDMVDWVLVSFRTGIEKNTEVAQAAAVLNKDGSLYFFDCGLENEGFSSLYILIEHRNHMGVMSPIAISVNNGMLTYDFRQNDTYRDITSYGQKQLPTGEWVMFAGDGNQLDMPSYDIQAQDKALWLIENGVFNQYTNTDFNLDGDVNGADKALWDANNGVSSRVPK